MKIMIIRMFTLTICLTMLLLSSNGMNSRDVCCEIKEPEYTCFGCIPRIIPQNITVVYLHRVNFADYAAEPAFNSTDWNHVTHLTVLPDNGFQESDYADFDTYVLHTKSFYHLSNLRHLKFNSFNLAEMERAVFEGLEHVEVIDLSDCINIDLKSITSGLEGSFLPQLKALYLSGVYQLSTKIVEFDSNFFNFIRTTKIETLDLSDTFTSFMDTESFSKSMPYLRSLNIENGGYLAAEFILAMRNYGNGSTFTNLKHVNFNYPIIPDAALSDLNIEDLLFESRFISNFTDIRARRCAPVAKGFVTDVIGVKDKDNSSIHILLDFKNKGLKWNSFRLLTDDNDLLFLETLDIGENGIKSIETSASKALGHLKHLDVSMNLLNKMSAREFETMLWYMPLLRIFNCSYNYLIGIPKETFRFSKHLEVIDISNNYIEHINLDLTHLTELILLDVSNNRIHTLSHFTIDMFSYMFTLNSQFKVKLEGNTFDCSCHSKRFIIWLINNKGLMNTTFTCSVDADETDMVLVNQQAVETIDYLCNLPKIYIGVGVGSALVGVVLVIVLIVCVRKYRKEQARLRLERAIKVHRQNKNKAIFPAFLSYCSSDANMVETHILPVLNRQLQTLLRTDKQCVSTGDISFAPGFYVAEEIVKCIESSCVILACVSKSFCKSFFCKDEILTAYHGSKPIILLFLENVDMKQLPKVVQKHFNTITRAKVNVDSVENKMEFTPDVDIICDAIVRLMKPTNIEVIWNM